MVFLRSGPDPGSRVNAPSDVDDDFAAFFAGAEPRLRRALIATYGSERGREAAAEALAYAWEHWTVVRTKDNPIGFLYRVGQSRTRPRKSPVIFAVRDDQLPWIEPGLADALARLSDRQRIAVVLIHGYGWHLREVADLIGTGVTTVQNHLERGLATLRAALEVHEDA
jgi:DNA-directed RNA polymerase specialized sigma24 family protein